MADRESAAAAAALAALCALPAAERHRRLAAAYAASKEAGARTRGDEAEAVRRTYRLLRTAEDDDALPAWELRLARRYFASLYREFAVADLSLLRRAEERGEHTGKARIGVRWRSEREVVSGKGQLSCGAVGCERVSGLETLEVDLVYEEGGERKRALVKLRACDACAPLLVRSGHAASVAAAGAQHHDEPRPRKKRRRRSPSDDGRPAAAAYADEPAFEGLL